jgi:hypothetical protein
MRWPIVLIYALLLLTLGCCVFSAARAKGFKPTPLPYSCEEVRTAIAHFTVPHLETIAKDFHITLTPYQRRQVAACMRGGK